MLLSATWLGLSVANRLVTPIRRLITATDQVSSGNLYVQVPVHQSDGDLGHLGETFNKMTSELRLQQNRLIAASRLIDERRAFTEAVLVRRAGRDHRHRRARASSPSSTRPPTKLLDEKIDFDPEHAAGRPIAEIVPELGAVLDEARASHMRTHQSQITLTRKGRERIFNVRVTTEQSPSAERNQVITLDDITDLVIRPAHLGVGGRRAAHRARDQESADADSVVGRAI